jgi:hypothetical protein
VLRKLKLFKVCNQWHELSQSNVIQSPIRSDENLCGIYENLPGQVEGFLLFTNRGIHLWQSSAWRTMDYSDIANTEWPTCSKAEVCSVTLRMKTGVLEELPIRGGAEFGGGAFDVMGFIDRVIEDINMERFS